MKSEKLLDHLFRHQYGKMVSVLTRIFGLNHLETIEDAVQDTFVSAMLKWRSQMPENPEAWLIKAAKNRAIDLLRKIKVDNERFKKLNYGVSAMAFENLFLTHEIEDSQLRMVFTACHPKLHPKDQIAFALKTIAGFSTHEIASALLLKEETIKKRLTRARRTIKDKAINFEFPNQNDLLNRLERVHEVLYLIFNEGFHSNHKKMLIRKELCGEALRLAKLVLKKEMLRNGAGYALFGLMCFQSARLDSKASENFESMDLKNQDRSQWYPPLIKLGTGAMNKAMDYPDYSTYHIEAAIAVEHLHANSFDDTNWNKILDHYYKLYTLQKDTLTVLNIAMILLQLKRYDEARELIDSINPDELEQRVYLYYGVNAEYYTDTGQIDKALQSIDEAIRKVSNQTERNYLMQKKERIKVKLN